MNIVPIETVYRGYRFRSRLEARWAVFFQTLGVRWEYEPEGFTLPNGKLYLPDFRVHLVDGPLWVEVKPRGADVCIFEEFISSCRWRGTVLHDVPPPEDVYNGSISDFRFMWGNDWRCTSLHCHETIFESLYEDSGYHFCICNQCGGVGFEWCGSAERIRHGCSNNDDINTPYHPKILTALAAARSARFEHGESP